MCRPEGVVLPQSVSRKNGSSLKTIDNHLNNNNQCSEFHTLQQSQTLNGAKYKNALGIAFGIEIASM